jgi:hypothetical protein
LFNTLPFQWHRIEFDLVSFDFLVSVLDNQQLFDLGQHCMLSLEQEIGNGKADFGLRIVRASTPYSEIGNPQSKNLQPATRNL